MHDYKVVTERRESPIARHDPAFCLAPGLFISLQKGERKKLKLDIKYRFGDKETIEFSGPEPLGADDLRVLQGLVAMSGPNGLILSPSSYNKDVQQLRDLLETKWEATDKISLAIRSSYQKLAKTIGYDKDSGSVFRILRNSIERLWKVSIIAKKGSVRQGFHLLSEYANNEKRGKLFIVLNPRIAKAILGGPHTRVDMNEVRALKSDSARILHQRLSAIIPLGKWKFFLPTTLTEYIWRGIVTERQQRQRYALAHQALMEIEATGGWKIKGKYEVFRKSIKQKQYL